VITSPTNTGIPGRDTADRRVPIYVRFTATTMSGTNPDGSHYSDPGSRGSTTSTAAMGVHGFIRPAYGYPQSLGCVELPITTAGEGLLPADGRQTWWTSAVDAAPVALAHTAALSPTQLAAARALIYPLLRRHDRVGLGGMRSEV